MQIFTTWQDKKEVVEEYKGGFFLKHGFELPHYEGKNSKVTTFKC
jgi:hypothetical protein